MSTPEKFSDKKKLCAETLDRVASDVRSSKNTAQMEKVLREAIEELECLGLL